MTDSKVQAVRKLLASGTPPPEVAQSLGVFYRHAGGRSRLLESVKTMGADRSRLFGRCRELSWLAYSGGGSDGSYRSGVDAERKKSIRTLARIFHAPVKNATGGGSNDML